jgi:hypothetical protein
MWGAARASGDKESSALFYRDRQAVRQPLGHRARRAAHTRFQLAHGISDTADLVRKLILGKIERPASPPQPRAEQRVVVGVGRLGMLVRHFVTLSVDQTMTTGQRACGLIHSSPRRTRRITISR